MLDPNLPRYLRQLQVTTILQHVFICAALKGCYGHYTTQFLQCLLMEEAPSQAVFVYGRFRKYMLAGFKSAAPDDFATACRYRYRQCSVARQWLEEDPTKAISVRSECSEMFSDEKERFRSRFADLWAILERLRARVVNLGMTRVECKVVLLGDEIAVDLYKHRPEGMFIIESPRAVDMATVLMQHVLAASVRCVIVCVGHADLRDGRRLEETLHACGRAAGILRQRFAHVKVVWLPPPFMHCRRDQWSQLVNSLNASVGSLRIRATSPATKGAMFWKFFETADVMIPIASTLMDVQPSEEPRFSSTFFVM